MAAVAANGSGLRCDAAEDESTPSIIVQVVTHGVALLLGAALLLLYVSARQASRRSTKIMLEEARRYDEVRHDLADCDEELLGRLSDGDIKLLNVEWLLYQHESDPSWRMCKRQDLKRMRCPAAKPAFLTPESAAALVEAQNRSVCVVSYGWTTSTDPDPTGEYLAVICQFLREHPAVLGVFWDVATQGLKPWTSFPLACR